MGYFGKLRYLLGLSIVVLGFFAFTNTTLAREHNDRFDVICNQDAQPGGAQRTCSLTRTLPGQMWRWEYSPVRTDEPFATVDVCINATGVWNDGICWNIQQRGGPGNSDGDDGNIDEWGYRTDSFNYFTAQVIVRSSATDDNNHTGHFEFYGREVEIEDAWYSTNPIPLGGSTTLNWRADFGHEQRLPYTDTDGSNGEDNPGNGQMADPYTDSEPYVNENGVPGAVEYKIKVWGPLRSGNYGFIERDFPTLIVQGSMTGTLTANYSTCTKSGSNTCNLVLTYTSNGANGLHIQKDTNDWRDMTVIPNGTTTEIDPQIGTHTYQLIGTDGGPWTGLATVTVTINPETSSGPGPTCSPGFTQTTIGSNVTFTAANGTNYTWTTSTNSVMNTGTPPSGSGNSFATSFGVVGTHRVNVVANGQTNYCTVFIPGTPVPPVTCSPSPDTANVYGSETYTASGGDGTYAWSVSADGSPMTGTGTTFTTNFSALGNKTVTVTSAGSSATCNVTVNSTNCPTLGAPTGQVLPIGTTSTTFNFNSTPGRTNYVVDVTTDPGFSWWWNNGTGSGGPGEVRPSSPITFSIQVPSGNITNNFYAGGNPSPIPFINGQTYYWRVYGYDANNLASGGCHSPIGSFSVGTTVPTFTITYEPANINPVTLAVNNDICRRMNLTWTYTPDGVAQGFRIYRSTTGTLGSYTLINSPAIGARSYSDTAVTVGQTYYYRVDTYTNSVPARQVASNEVTSTPLECTADFSPSTYSIYQVNGVNYVPGTTTIADGSAVTFRMIITNIGPANGTITSLTNTMSPNLTNFRNYTINKGNGNVTTAISATASGDEQVINMGLTGTKCVSPDNPTSCANSTDRSCTTSGTPVCNNWVLTFTADVDATGDNNLETIEGVGRIAFTDGTGARFQNIYMTTNLFRSGNPLPPDFREVAP